MSAMRALVWLPAVALAAGCGGGANTADPGPVAPRAEAPDPTPSPLRVELGRCTATEVPFVSGLRPRVPASLSALGIGGFGLRGSGGPVEAGDPSATGALDKNIIRRYIRRNLARIRLCYERQLLVDPKLSGTVTAKFAIEPDGSVSGVSASGLHADVDSCVASVIAKIQFPKPRGGGYVNVTYPFRFRSASPAIGKGSGTGSGYGRLGGRRASAPQVRIGGVTAAGKLDKNIIRRFIRRNLSRIRLCYERQLVKDPSLAGTVVAKFTIDSSGKVASSNASGLHPDVDRCVAGAIAAVVFPKPKGGGKVTVRYPFIFRSGSSTPAEARKQVVERARSAGILGALGGVETFETPLGPAREAIERCAREYLVGSDALVVDLRGDQPARARSSSNNRQLERCVAAAAAAVKSVERRCPIALGAADPSSLPRILLDRGALRFNSERIDSLDRGGESALSEKLSAFRAGLVAPGFTPAVARLGPVVLQVSGDTEVREVRRIRALVERADLYAALAIAGGSSPRLLRADPLPWVPVPASILAVTAGPRVAISIGRQISVEATGGEPVIIELAGARDQIRAALGGLDTKTPIVISAAPDRRFADVVTVIDALSAAGYASWDLE